MPVLGLDHVNIRTVDVAASARFYVDLFDFTYRPGSAGAGIGGHWLHDANGRPIIHFRVRESESRSTGPLDHVALRCSGKAEIVRRLHARDIPFRIAEGFVQGVTQVFVQDPHGVLLELSFADEGVHPDA